MSAPVQPGDVLDGKFRIDRVLGVGGMGVVVAAQHINLDQHVAIKFLLPEALRVPSLVERFSREARAAAKIQSEHVARVIDVATMPNGSPYMVMEYLDGSDLSQHIQKHGALAITDAVDWVLQACEALAEAHVNGIIHRDLKPANLFLARRADGGSIIKVLDFGISKLSDASEAAMTKTTSVMGSPLYMSPEQLKSSRAVDARSDIWSLGIILHEIIAGHVPFTADSMPQLCAMILTEPPPPLRQIRPDVPAGVEQVVQRCLAQNPNGRFAHVGDLAAALCVFGTNGARESAAQIARVLQQSGRILAAPSVPPPPGSYPNMSPMGATGPSMPSTGRGGHHNTAMAAALAATGPPGRGGMGPGATAAAMAATGPHRPGGMMPGASTNTAWGNTSQNQAQLASSNHSPAPPAKANPAAVILGICGALVVVSALVGGVVYARGRSAQTAAASGVPTTFPADTKAGKEASIQLSITAQPAEAKIFVDDAEVGSNPYTAKLKMDGSSHKVRIEAPGHETQQRFAVFDKDVTIDVALTKEKAVTGPAQPATAPATPASPSSKTAASASAPGPAAPAPAPAPAPTKPGKKMYDDPW